MTGIKIAMVFSLVGLVGVIESDHIDSWAKLTAVPILGAVAAALVWLLSRQQKTHSEAIDKQQETHSVAIDKVVDCMTEGFKGIREDNKDAQDSQIELLKQAIEK